MDLFTKARTLLFTFCIGCSLLLISCLETSSPEASTTTKTLLEKAGSFEELSTFVTKAEDSNLSSMISDSNAYTMFAPTNEAFNQLPGGTLDTLTAENLTEVLSYHLSDTVLFTNDFDPVTELKSLQGEKLYLSLTSSNIVINQGVLVAGNYPASNGILHATDNVLFPDSYLDVTGIYGKRYELERFDLAVTSTALDSILTENTSEGYTIFAPTNSSVAEVGLPENKSGLRDTLEYHMLLQKFRTEDFQSSQMLKTMNGHELKVEVQNNTIVINDEKTLKTTNLEGTNGVVHTIDGVLIPPANH